MGLTQPCLGSNSACEVANRVKLRAIHPGYWIYQSPRILMLLAYALARRLDAVRLVQSHLAHVNERVSSRNWMLIRLGKLGYEPKRSSATIDKQISRADSYISKLGLDANRVAEVVDAVLRLAGGRDPYDAALLPPQLTLPEKLLLLEALVKSEHFGLADTLDLVVRSWLTGTKPTDLIQADSYSARREFRFRFCYLYALHLASGDVGRPRPTGLGTVVRGAVEVGENVARAYLRYLAETGRLGFAAALDVDALQLYTIDGVRRLLAEYSRVLAGYLPGAGDILGAQLAEALVMPASDVAEVGAMALPARQPEEMARLLEM